MLLNAPTIRTLALYSLIGPLAALAQINTGSLNGTIQDSTGLAVPAATVTVTNQASGVKRDTESNDQGLYSVPLLQPGIYTVSASKAGFSTSVQKDVQLAVNQAARADITLQVGKVGEVVEVKADSAAIETESANLGTVIEQRQVTDLPLNGRNYTQLLLLAPGVAPFNTNRPAPSLWPSCPITAPSCEAKLPVFCAAVKTWVETIWS